MGPFSDARVIALLSKNFVPVAVNLYQLREAKDEYGQLYQAIHKQKPQYQGFWVVAPDGKVLSWHHDKTSEKTWTDEVLAALNKGLKAFGKVEPRAFERTDPHPRRGKGFHVDGEVTLAIYIRRVHAGQFLGAGVVDSLTLSARELDQLAPQEFKKGHAWEVPAALVKKFGRCLSPDSDLVTMPLPHEATKAQLTGKVYSIDGDVVTLTYAGQVATVHRHLYEKEKTNKGQAHLAGTARYDLQKRQMLSVTFVLDGVFHNFQPYDREAIPLVAGLEWTYKVKE